jgi:CRISPR-associated protein Csm4
MDLYRVRIRMLSGSRTPLHSDTLFGSVCWAVLYLEGEDRLRLLLHNFKENKPAFILSDGFPHGFLPRPAGGNYTIRSSGSNSKEEIMANMKTAKLIKQISYIPLYDMQKIIQGEKISLANCTQPEETSFHMTTHNTIDRETGASAEGGLFRELYRWDGDMDIYALAEDEWQSLLMRCLELISVWGYGGGASRGRGAFKIEDTCKVNFDTPEDPNAYMTLSRCIPTQDMSVQCQYRLDVKYGRFGQERGKGGYPFKKPVLMLEPGAVFWGTPPECGWCGAMADNLSDEYSDTVQSGLSIILPCRIDPPEWGA